MPVDGDPRIGSGADEARPAGRGSFDGDRPADAGGARRHRSRRRGEDVRAGGRDRRAGCAGVGLLDHRFGTRRGDKDGRPVAEVGEHGVVGEMALFNANVHTGEVRAVEDCRVLFVPTAPFVQLVLRQEPAAVKLMESLGRLLIGALEELDARDARARRRPVRRRLRRAPKADGRGLGPCLPRARQDGEADGQSVEARRDCGGSLGCVLARGRGALHRDPGRPGPRLRLHVARAPRRRRSRTGRPCSGWGTSAPSRRSP